MLVSGLNDPVRVVVTALAATMHPPSGPTNGNMVVGQWEPSFCRSWLAAWGFT
jgi:hypothetical protein